MVYGIACAYYNTVLVHKSNFLGQTLLFCFRANTKHLRRDQRCHFTTTIDISYYYSRVSRLRPPVNWTHFYGTTRNISREPTTSLFFTSWYILHYTVCTYFDILLPTFIDILFWKVVTKVQYYRSREWGRVSIRSFGRKCDKDVQRLISRYCLKGSRPYYILCIPFSASVSS